MAEIDRLVAVLEADISQFKNGMKQATSVTKKTTDIITSSTKKMREGFNNVGSSVMSLKGLLAGIGVGAVAGSFINAASTAEGFQVRLKTLLGSVSEANKLFDDMSTFAGKVPFEYEKIMGAATQLSSVLKGGRDEVNKFMPMLTDLAAAYGITIEQAADQFARASSAGAGAADIFRDRGINAMLGFQAGSSSTGEEFVKNFEKAFNKTNSKFRGASADLANTWTGTMSMISDKWFQFRNTVMEAGVFDFIKGLAKVIDQRFGDALKNSKGEAVGWANTIINGIGTVMKAVATFATAWQGMEIIWEALKMGFEGMKLLLLEGLEEIIGGINKVKTFFGGEPIDGGAIALWKEDTIASIEEIKQNMADIAAEPTALQQTVELLEQAKVAAAEFAEQRAASAATEDGGKGGGAELEPPGLSKEDEKFREQLASRLEALDEALMSEEERLEETYANRLMLLMEAQEAELLTTQEHADKLLEVEVDHEKKLAKAKSDAAKKQQKVEDNIRKSTLNNASSFFSNMMAMSQNSSRGMFNAMKAGAIATTVIQTYESAQKAFNSLADIPIIGTVLGGIAAAAAVASGMARVNAIRSTSFGGGGGGGAAGGGGGGAGGGGGGAGAAAAPTGPITPGGLEPGGAAGGVLNVQVNLGDEDEIISKRSIRMIMEGMNEQIEDGAQIGSINIV